MFLSTRSIALALAAGLFFVNAADAQIARQSLKDAWVATSQNLYEAHFDGTSNPDLKNAGDVSRDFKAIAFEAPQLGSPGAAVRDLIAIDGTEVWRFENGGIEADPVMVFDAADAPSSLRYVTAVAVTDTGTILISGYSRPKRVFEIWEITPATSDTPASAAPRATSTPQLTEAVFVRPEDVVAGSSLAGGGLLATAGKQVLFFRKTGGYMQTVVLLDARALGLKGATELTSVDLVRETNTLMLATTERKLLTAPAGPGAVTAFADIPGIQGRNCAALKPQRLVVRNAQPGDAGSSFVSDACGQVLHYDFDTAMAAYPVGAAVPAVQYAAGTIALAVGEGNEITCDPSVSCPLISGGAFDAFIDSTAPSQMLVLQFPNLCDRRVAPSTCTIGVTDTDNNLIMNSLLPPAMQAALANGPGTADDVTIKIPPYMFAAGYNGAFGAVFVQADQNAASSSAIIELDIEQLAADGAELGVRVDFERFTETLPLLNQDIAAYAPDNFARPTVRGFEAAPITVGVRNPMIGALRGFSAIVYGLQHDVNPPSARTVDGGIPAGTVLGGSQRLCPLTYGAQTFTPVNLPSRYFVNLAACLFADEEALLLSPLLDDALAPTARSALVSALGQVKDKLIKALSGAGPNTGSETFQALQTQLDQFDSRLAATTFVDSLAIYKNELQVRSTVLRFNLTERTYPSLPLNGF